MPVSMQVVETCHSIAGVAGGSEDVRQDTGYTSVYVKEEDEEWTTLGQKRYLWG